MPSIEPTALLPREADGRTLGRRGQATRQRLLDSLETMLASTPYRDITVIEIARGAQTSPATFYQYFADIESAVIILASAIGERSTLGDELLHPRRWRGVEGRRHAAVVVDAFLEFWTANRAVLRVVDLLTEEGDERLRAVRVRMLNVVTRALADVIAGERTATSTTANAAEPVALAGVLVSMLAHVAAHQSGFEEWEIKMTDVREALINVLYWGITSPRLPAG